METSPYLLQHAQNPVDWYPWGNEALEMAQKEDKPILLSIGYAACHWCHVMAHESFEDPETAELMNAHFINIKVDREERPDIDSIYMQAVQAINGHGGWPLTAFLLPSGEPFFGGTYFPPTDRQGLPSFKTVLHSIAEAYRDDRSLLVNNATNLMRIYQAAEAEASPQGDFQVSHLARCAATLVANYDHINGGFGGAPKFPPTMALDFLVRHHARTGEQESLRIARETFLKMGYGGIYDQIGGGFARYTVDAAWVVPHFEKMLYDNALLVRLGSHLYQLTKDAEIRRITEGTLKWLEREMTSPEGGWYSSYDADSEGEEGKFYIWTEAEIDEALDDMSGSIKEFFGLNRPPNFEGKYILTIPQAPSAATYRDSIIPPEVQSCIDMLYKVRSQRPWPGLDNKIIASWNGLMLRGMVEAARTFTEANSDHDSYRAAAVKNACFLRDNLLRDGVVYRTHGNSPIQGFLEDYCAIALGFLGVFELTLDRQWYVLARRLTDKIMADFWDPTLQVFFDSPSVRSGETQLITRPRNVADNAIPSGTSLAVDLLFRMASLTDSKHLRERAQFIMDSLSQGIMRYPLSFGHMLGAAEYGNTFSCLDTYCDMPSPEAVELATNAPPQA